MDHKEPVYDPRDPSRAPEVAPSYSPIPALRESEGLQVGQDYTSGKEAVAHGQSIGGQEEHAHYGEAAIAPRPKRWYRRKRWWIAIALLVVAVIAAAVGAGIGASGGGGGKEGDTSSDGQAQDDKSGESQTTTDPAATATATATGTSEDSPSTVSSAATAPATSGVAAFSCSNGTYMYSAQPAGLAYIEHCNTMYAYNNPSIFSVPEGNIEGLFSSTKYSFADCVDSCDTWNDDNPDADAPCRSVSYYANLTNVFTLHQEWGGNCILKSGVGGVVTNNTDDSTADWALTASAYRACLQQETPCDASS